MIFLKELLKFFFLLVVILLSFVLWIHSDHSPITWNSEVPKQKELNEKETENENKEPIVTVTRQDGRVVKLPLETYLLGVVGSEMPASFEEEALKAQCVAARTFVTKRNYEVDDTTRTQVYHDDEQMKQIWGNNYETYHEKIRKALADTKGEILTYNGDVISAVFFSSSCGKTANSEEYWSSNTPYLRSVDSPWEKNMKGYEVVVTIKEDDFLAGLGFQNAIKELGKPIYYDTGYVKEITIDTITFSGREVREKLNLRSSSFSIKAVAGGYEVKTLGYGHGLGMSQEGAQGMALEGSSYQDILLHYYLGVKIEKKGN